jgi:hypothetical protein
LSTPRVRFILLGLASLLGYAWVTWLSFSFVYGQGHQQRPILLFIGLYAVTFGFYLLALRNLLGVGVPSPLAGEACPELSRRGQDGGYKGTTTMRPLTLSLSREGRGDLKPSRQVEKLKLLLVLGFALLFRVVLLFSNPIQEDDFYRYLWDGKVVASGLNPYSVTPNVVLDRTRGLSPWSQILDNDPHFALILSRVNHPEVPTIYPPLAQVVFGATALLAPGSLLALRVVFLAFDLGSCGLILALLKQLGINPVWVFVYAWSPLVIKESINSAHYDVIPTFFLVLALLLSLKGKHFFSFLSLALAIMGKIYPVVLVAVFTWRTWQTQGITRVLLGLGIMIATIIVGYAPFWDAGGLLWQGTLAFAERWQTNSFLFPLLHRLVGERWVANTAVSLLLGCTVLAVLGNFDVREEKTFLWVNFLILGVLFLLSPVGNPWYFLWLLPFLCVFPLRSWLLLSGLLGLYYLWFYFLYRGTAETFRWVIWLEYLPFYGMLAWEWFTFLAPEGRKSVAHGVSG